MAEWIASNGNFWKPTKKGDEIQGVLVKVELEVGVNKSTLYYLEESGKGVTQVWGTTVLDSRMAPVKVGQEVLITYLGEAEKGGVGKNKPKLFDVQYRNFDIVQAAKEIF